MNHTTHFLQIHMLQAASEVFLCDPCLLIVTDFCDLI